MLSLGGNCQASLSRFLLQTDDIFRVFITTLNLRLIFRNYSGVVVVVVCAGAGLSAVVQALDFDNALFFLAHGRDALVDSAEANGYFSVKVAQNAIDFLHAEILWSFPLENVFVVVKHATVVLCIY